MHALWRQWIDAGRFALDTQAVIALRVMKIASGGPLATAEAQRMVTEKVAALAFAQMTGGLALATGQNLDGATRRAMSSVHRSVRANRRRLSRKHR
jgi:hypothetical protein